MRLISLKMQNFMAYKGSHEINFDVTPQSPVILFLGENGHGKSTIQHAARWCLYGHTYDREREIRVPLLLNRKASSSEGYASAEVSVTLTWLDNDETYELERSWNAGDAPLETTHASLRCAGAFLHAAAIPETVQRFLAKEISHFFFFNGEVQKEFDDMVSNAKSASFIRNEIEKTLSIPVIAECVDWLSSKRAEENAAIVRTNERNEEVGKKRKLLADIRDKLSVLQEEYSRQLEKYEEANRKVREVDDQVGDVEAAHDIHDKIVELGANHKRVQRERDELGDALCSALSRYPWLSLSLRIISLRKDIARELEIGDRAAAQAREIDHAIGALEDLQLNHVCPVCQSTHSELSPVLETRLGDLRKERSHILVPDTANLRWQSGLISSLRFDENVFVETRNLLKNFNALGGDLADINQKLRNAEIQLEIMGNPKIEDLLANQRAWIGARDKAEKNLNGYVELISEAKNQESRYMNDIAKRSGISPRNQVAYNAYSYLAALFSFGKVRYTLAVKDAVQRHASETFMDIISDKKYQGLRINENYGVDLVMDNGEIDPVPSTGQGKVSTISLVSGLIKTVMPEGFVLMDTPFVSLDSGHREQVCKWAAESGLYVSLFMHSGEFDRDQLMGFFENRIARIFHIKQIDNNESTINEEL